MLRLYTKYRIKVLSLVIYFGSLFSLAQNEAIGQTTTPIVAEADTEIWTSKPNDNYGLCNTVFIDRANNQRGLFRFNLSGLPANAIITNAQLRLVKFSGNDESFPLSVHAITNPWTEGNGACTDGTTGNATYNNRTTGTPWTTAGGDFGAALTTINVAGDGTYNWTVTNTVIAWKSGTLTNNGLLVKFVTDGGSAKEKSFASRENSTSANHPRLVVTYTLLTASVSATNVTCNGANNGSITVSSPSGGASPYEYRLNSGAWQTSNVFPNLAPGAYSVNIRDANLNVANVGTQNITQPAVLNAAISSTNITCGGGNNGTITLSGASGGSGSYQYRLNAGTWQSSTSFPNLVAGTYSVQIRDANNTACVITLGNRTITQPAALSGSASKTDVTCFGANNGTITVSSPAGGSGSFQYRLNSGSWQASPNFSGLTSGTYLVQIRDANSTTCENTIATLSIAQPAVLGANGFVTAVNCNGSSTGSITQTITGGTSPYSYIWSDGPANTKDRTNLAAGTYTVTVTDNKGCQVSRAYVVTQPTALVVTNTVVQPTCGVSGSIVLSVSGGTGPYTFNWSDLPGTNDPQNRSSLEFGSYSVVVTDSRGCVFNQNFVLNNPGCGPGKIICIAGNTNDQFSVTPDVTIESYVWTVPAGAVIVSGQGTPNIVVNWTGATPGEGQVCVKTINDCGESQNYCENVLLKLVNATASATIACQGGSLQLFANGGIEFRWTGPNGFVSNLQNPLLFNISSAQAGVYTVTVIDDDGCSSTATVNVAIQPGFTLTGTVQTSACGLNIGSIDISVIGGQAPFTYLWSNGANTQDIINVGADNYTVTVTDANGCTNQFTGSVGDIEGPSVSASVTNLVCNGQATGAINLTVNSGTAPYTFLWSNGATTEDISGLSVGVFGVAVVDAFGCVATLSRLVNQPDPIQVSIARTNLTCFGANNGSIALTVSGGNPGYTYTWSDGGPAIATRTNLTAGVYLVTISDASGCSVARTVIVSQPNPIQATPTKKNILCAGETNGIISVSITGGVAPLTYSWSGPNGFVATTKDILNLAAGTYNLVITDANGCTFNLTETITSPAVLAASSTVTNVACFGTATGSVQLQITGGTAPFSFLWSNGVTTQNLTGVPAGVYAVLITDANGCITTASGVVGSPSPLLVGFTKTDVLCFGGATGAISVQVTGGTGSYSYLWSDGPSTAANRTNLTAGNYTVTVTDANGCSLSQLFTITSNPQIVATSTLTPVSCFGTNTGAITLSVNGGSGTYTYAWSNGLSPTANQQNLVAGTYTVTIADGTGCSVIRNFTVTQPTALAVSGTKQNVLCNGANNGSINLTPTGGVAPYTYAWSSGQSTQNVSGLSPGTYTVVVTDFNLCSISETFVITEPTLLGVQSTVTPNCLSQSNGSVALNTTGGTGPYSYAWTGSGTGTSARFGLAAGSYTVTVTDANGCSYIETFAIVPLTVSLNPVVVSCLNDDGSIIANVEGGIEPYSYTWSNGQTTADISNLVPGLYSVTVTSGACSVTSSVTLNPPTGCLPPVAVSESFTTAFRTPITQTATPTNPATPGYDSDPVFPLSELIFENFTGAPDSVGVILFGNQGNFTFTPADNFVGSFSWLYSICNPLNLCDTATLTITVLPNAILATNDTYGPINGRTGIVSAGNVLVNDLLTGLPATLSNVTLQTVVAEPTGKVTLNPNGTVSVAPLTPAGNFQFTYRICEILIPSNCDTATVSVTVVAPPIDALNDVSMVTIEETIGGVAIADVRINDLLNSQPVIASQVTIAVEGTWPTGITLNPTTGAVSVSASVPAGNYAIDYKLCEVLNPTNCDVATISLVVSIPPFVKLRPKVYLQGSLYGVALPDTLMRDDLRVANRLPLNHPYSYLSPVTSVGAVNSTIFSTSGQNAIVDWVFVELRSALDSTVVVDSRAALLQRDGDIVDLDGTSAVQFGTATNTQRYFVAVRHRNHLGVMTAIALNMTPTGLLVDFRKASTPTFRFSSAALNQAQVIVQQGRALWAGNTERDRQIIYQGTQNDVNPVYNRVISDPGNFFVLPTFKSRGYLVEDVDMNGEGIFQGTGNDLEFIYQNIISNHPGNTFVLPFFTIREQLP